MKYIKIKNYCYFNILPSAYKSVPASCNNRLYWRQVFPCTSVHCYWLPIWQHSREISETKC